MNAKAVEAVGFELLELTDQRLGNGLPEGQRPTAYAGGEFSRGDSSKDAGSDQTTRVIKKSNAKVKRLAKRNRSNDRVRPAVDTPWKQVAQSGSTFKVFSSQLSAHARALIERGIVEFGRSVDRAHSERQMVDVWNDPLRAVIAQLLSQRCLISLDCDCETHRYTDIVCDFNLTFEVNNVSRDQFQGQPVNGFIEFPGSRTSGSDRKPPLEFLPAFMDINEKMRPIVTYFSLADGLPRECARIRLGLASASQYLGGR